MEFVVLAAIGAGFAALGFALGRRSGRRAAVDDGRAELAAVRAAKERAELDVRSKTAFLSRMSHELRTPLTIIVGFSEVVQSELFGPLSPRYREYVRGIMQSSRSLTRLLSDLLDLCEIEAEELALHDEVVQPRDIVAACIQLLGQRALRRGCVLSSEVDAALPALRADSRRLKQMLLNVLGNALERSGEGAEVTVAVSRSGEGMVFRVTDEGVASLASDPLTTGLDLARSLVELHGGRLRLIELPEGGLTVEILMPASRLAHAGAAENPV